MDVPWSKTDAVRERELLRYFAPPSTKTSTKASQYDLSIGNDDPLSASAPSSPETTLTALAQLCALRLNASRAMASLISKDTQYFICEATKTLDLGSNGYDCDGDALWVGCTSVDKSGRLCEKTIELPASPGAYPCFTVTDLSQDERFSKLPFVAGPPNFRFYAGTPLTTKKGINIGSLFILDDRVRPRLLPAQEKFLGTIAATIMSHLEVNREAEERKKVLRMAKGLNAFVEGKDSFSDDPLDEPSINEPLDRAPQDTELVCENLEHAHKGTFSRAAHLLNDSMNLQSHGGVCFLDTTTGLRSMIVQTGQRKTTEAESESDAKEPPRKDLGADGSSGEPQRLDDRADTKSAGVISSSCSKASLLPRDDITVSDLFTPPAEQFLQSLLHYYPRGKVWIFDDEMSTSEEDEMRALDSGGQRRTRPSRKQIEKEALRKCFPNAYELIFVPLWDASISRWFAGCFCWSGNRNYSIEAGLQFVTAFGNSIMAEISRLSSIYESKQKSDFIGSISHELRSPLHGILGSAEFLCETKFDAFQESLVDTISSCGRTLLDTIDHILDYSKIASFERNWRNAVRKPKSGSRSVISVAAKRAVAKEAPPMMSIYAVTDVAAIVEEVVEGVYAGQMFRGLSSADITDVSAGQRGRTSERGLSLSHQSQLGGSFHLKSFKNIEVVLDIANGDYLFTTQPGALRRVIMNIFGNSLKYTTTGKIVVSLRLRLPSSVLDLVESEHSKDSILDISVTDTGKGISSDYLRTGLYTAFSQEDALANGTGLGLSIVRSIVTMLEGTIDIKSEVDKGTKVHVQIPLSRAASGTEVSTPSSMGSPDKMQENSISILQTNYPSRTVSMYISHPNEETETCRAARYYVKEWFMLPYEPNPLEHLCDVVIVEEYDLPELLKRLQPGPALLVLSSKTHLPQVIHTLYSGAVESMSTPFGPYKLAKAIRLSLEKADQLAADPTPQTQSTIQSPRTFEHDAVNPAYSPVTMDTGDETTPIIQLRTNGSVTASVSSNARMALGTALSGSSTESRGDFPFPSQGSSGSGADTPRSAFAARPKLSSRRTEPIFRSTLPFAPAAARQDQLATSVAPDDAEVAVNVPLVAKQEPTHIETTERAPPISQADDNVEKRSPRILVVDDNEINRRLLQTFLHKRQYEFVDSVEDGSLAVEAARIHEQGYDIIFMDLSMPVMNGFEATRAIRELEKTRDRDQPSNPAMIIALTGLASGRDHSEAFACGVDLYMTKPVSFRQVGRLLDNWKAHGGLDDQK